MYQWIELSEYIVEKVMKNYEDGNINTGNTDLRHSR